MKTPNYRIILPALFSVFIASLLALYGPQKEITEASVKGAFILLSIYSVVIFCIIYTIASFFWKKVDEAQPVVQNQTNVKDGDIFYYYGDYHYGYSRVEELHVISVAEQKVQSKFAFANEAGEIVTKWFEGATDFEKPGVAVVYDNGRYNFLDKDCQLILLNWPKNIGEEINDNKLKVYWDDGTINFVDFKKKCLLWKDWKKSVS
jgi:hypothetical protein